MEGRMYPGNLDPENEKKITGRIAHSAKNNPNGSATFLFPARTKAGTANTSHGNKAASNTGT